MTRSVRYLFMGLVASALLVVPGQAVAAVDPLTIGKLPKALKVVSATGTRTYAWASAPDAEGLPASSSEVFKLKLMKAQRFTTTYPQFKFTGPVSGLADVPPSVVNCTWGYDGSKIGANAGLTFDRLSRSRVLVGITFAHGVTKHADFVSKNPVCDNNVVGMASLTQSVSSGLGVGNSPCNGTHACKIVSRGTITRRSFSIRFSDMETLTDGATITTDVTLNFRRA